MSGLTTAVDIGKRKTMNNQSNADKVMINKAAMMPPPPHGVRSAKFGTPLQAPSGHLNIGEERGITHSSHFTGPHPNPLCAKLPPDLPRVVHKQLVKLENCMQIKQDNESMSVWDATTFTRNETELARQMLLDLPKIDYDIQLWAIDWLKSKYLPKEIMDLLEGIASCKITRLNERKSDALSSPYQTPLGPLQELAFELLSEVHPMTYLVNCIDAWVTATGQDPNSHPLNQALFRQAVLGGCPSDVQKMMTNSPTLPTSDDVNWQTHFLYYVQQFRIEAKEETEKTSKLQNNFLNSRIQEAKRASSNACKKEKLGGSNQMSISVSQQAPPRLITPPPQLQAPPQHYGLPTRQGRDAWLGGGPRREGGRGRGSHGSQAGCFICGDVNHWIRKCPHRRHRAVHQSSYDQQALTPPPQNQQQ